MMQPGTDNQNPGTNELILIDDIPEDIDTDIEQVTDTTPKGIPISLLVALRKKNLSYSQIAKVVGCHKSNVVNRLRQVRHLLDSNDTFKDNRADVLSVYQQMILEGITPEKIKDISVRDAVVAMGVLYDKERLERNLSTENVAIEAVVERKESALAAAQEARRKIEQLKAKRALLLEARRAGSDTGQDADPNNNGMEQESGAKPHQS